MRFQISAREDSGCRYLRCGLVNSWSSFNRLVKELGILDEFGEADLRQWLEARIIVPSSIVYVPDEYYESWRNYPEIPADFHGYDELRWADFADTIPFPSPGERHWFLHPYDQTDPGEGIPAYKEHRIPFSVPLPENKKTVQGFAYNNWAIHLPYWQTYRLYDALKHGVVLGMRRSFDEPEEYCRCFLAGSQNILRMKEAWLDSIMSRWDNYAPCFDALSHFRSVVGLASTLESQGGSTWNTNISNGGKLLVEHLGIDASTLESYLPEVLLRLHRDWSDRRAPAPPHLLLLLQQDIFFFMLWLRILTGKSKEEYYEKYENQGRCSRGYSDLLEALPEEAMVARKSLPKILSQYLKDAPSGIFKSCQAVRLEELFSKMEAKAPVAKAWVRNFHRLHEGLRGGDRISFVDESTVDCAALMAVKTETLLADLWGIDTSGNTLRPIVKAAITQIGESNFRYTAGFHAISKDWKNKTNSATSLSDVESYCAALNLDEGNRWFARQLLHFARARNFIVHKSSFREEDLDEQVSKMFTAMIQILVFFVLEWDQFRANGDAKKVQSLTGDMVQCSKDNNVSE